MLCRLDPPAGGPANMSLDLDLLTLAEEGRPGIRVYSWEGPWATLGRYQDPSRALAPGCSIPWVCRPTGGRGVLHGHDLTVGGGLPLAMLGLAPGEFRQISRVQKAVLQPLVAALRSCGLDAELASGFASGGTEDCFAHVGPCDVIHSQTRAKIVGCALKVTESAVLIQASIPAGPPLVDPASVFPDPGPSAWAALDGPSLAAALERDFTVLAG